MKDGYFPIVMMRFMEDGKGFMVTANKAIRPEVVAEGIVGLLLGNKELREIFLSLSENVQGDLEKRIKDLERHDTELFCTDGQQAQA